MSTILNKIVETKKLDSNGNPRYRIDVEFMCVPHNSTDITKKYALRKTKKGFSFQSYNLRGDLIKLYEKGIILNPYIRI